jgi:hypothetical protein
MELTAIIFAYAYKPFKTSAPQMLFSNGSLTCFCVSVSNAARPGHWALFISMTVRKTCPVERGFPSQDMSLVEENWTLVYAGYGGTL